MAKPVINRITPFDAHIEKTITMTYSGNMAYSNKIVIYNAETMIPVFEDTTASLLLKHVIPAYVLQNGVKYAITAQIFDKEGIASAISNKQYFWCFETPSFYFQNLTSGDVINSASYNVSVAYEQSDWEDISSYKFEIYDDLKSLLLESSIMYGDDISYTFRRLESGRKYYIRCTGTTINGMILDTGYIEIKVQYENPNIYARIYADCNTHTGIVNYRTNIRYIDASTNDEFEYDNGMIKLINKSLVYEDGFLIDGDFSMIIRGKNLYHTGIVLTGKNKKYGFTLSSYIYDEGKLRFKLTVPNGLCNYILYSNELVFDDTNMVAIEIKRIRNIYSLKCTVENNIVLMSDDDSQSDTQYTVQIGGELA